MTSAGNVWDWYTVVSQVLWSLILQTAVHCDSHHELVNIWLHYMLWMVQLPSAIHTAATDRRKLMTLVAGKCRCLLMAGDDDEVFMTRILNIMPKTTEQQLTVCSGKSESKITIIKDCTWGITLLKQTTDGHKASCGLSATAELLVST